MYGSPHSRNIEELKDITIFLTCISSPSKYRRTESYQGRLPNEEGIGRNIEELKEPFQSLLFIIYVCRNIEELKAVARLIEFMAEESKYRRTERFVYFFSLQFRLVEI